MKEERFKIPFIWALVIGIIIIVIMGLTIKSLNNSISYYNKNYQYVPEGKTSFYCDSGQQSMCYEKSEYILKYDTKTESATTCNALQGYQAVCVKGNTYTSCQDNQIPFCVDKDQSWATCQSGQQATCLDKTKQATWDGNYVINCPVGYISTCTK